MITFRPRGYFGPRGQLSIVAEAHRIALAHLFDPYLAAGPCQRHTPGQCTRITLTVRWPDGAGIERFTRHPFSFDRFYSEYFASEERLKKGTFSALGCNRWRRK
jgi:hypothetical protein